MATWLEQVNAYRALANLPAVTEDPAFSEADRRLAEYFVKSGSGITHILPEGNPNATAAKQSNLAESSDPNFSNDQAVFNWLSSVFSMGLGSSTLV